MSTLLFLVCFAASTIGGICGIGGGVIIKPVADAMNIMSVSQVSFLSGLTVLAMSVISVFGTKKGNNIELKTGSLLAAGAVLGGIAGNALFQLVRGMADNEALVGMTQAVTLAIVTVATLVYSSLLRNKVKSFTVTDPIITMLLGVLMGMLSAFLGIGGGPINLAVLYFAFSMDTKKAAATSLYIIMASQLASFITSLLKGTIPNVPWQYLLLMVAGGMLGGLLGARINKRISAEHTDRLFSGLLCVIVIICIYNAVRFAA